MTEWAIFEPNGPELWARIAAAVEEVLEDLFDQGSLAGASPGEAYFVRCGMALSAQSEIDEGSVNIVVGFAPLEPAEFVIVSIKLLLGQGEP